MNASNEIPWFFSYFFPWPFIVVGVGMFYEAVRELLRAHMSHNWAITEGKIVNSWVKTHVADDYQTEHYEAIIDYQYTVNGMIKTFHKTKLTVGNGGREAYAEAIVRRYPEDSRVRVYCSPRDSNFAVLEPGINWAHFPNLFVSIFFILSGFALLWVFGWFRWLVL